MLVRLCNTLALSALSIGCLASSSAAGTYEVKACDAASLTGNVNNSWLLSATAGHAAQSLCPSLGNDVRGLSTRLVTGTVGAGTFERAGFYAPLGTTIDGVTWAGRWARESCTWASEMRARPSERTIIGYRENNQCGAMRSGLYQPFFVPAPAGTTVLIQNVQCGAGSCPAGATFHTFYASVRVNDPTPPSVRLTGRNLASPGWRRGVQQVSYEAGDNSGISRVELQIDGTIKGSNPWPCDHTRTAPCLGRGGTMEVNTADSGDGFHTLRLEATDAAGNRGSVSRVVGTDNTPPGRIRPAVVGGEGWRRSNGFTVRWDNPAQSHAPIVRARYRLCPAGGVCVEGSQTGRDIEQLSNLSVPRLGDNTLDVWLEDEAGNHSRALASDPVRLRLDPEAPRLAFLSQDASDPLRISVTASDSYSGVAGGEIEMRARGGRTWHELATRLEGRRLVADIDDERLGAGVYDFRARAVDRAGNESSTGTRTDGARAAVRLPVRITTGLRAGFLKTKTVRRLVLRKGRKKLVRRKVQVLVPTGRLRFGGRGLIRGTLANPDGQPIDGASITAFAVPDSGGEPQTLGLVRTDSRGRFSYAVKGTGNRRLRFHYSGTRRIRGATGDVKVQVPASTSMSANPRRLLNGQAVAFEGRVRSGPVPASGKLIEIQAYFRRRWRTISTTRSAASGLWRFPYRFGATVGTVRYRFRARLPVEGGYGFATGRSRVVTVIVRGL